MITTRIFYRITALILVACSLYSCNDWLDVKPKTQVDSDDNFSNEQGYKDALTGVYMLLTKESLYGRQLSYGLVDVLGQQYTEFTSTHTYYQASIYNYTEDATKAMIDGAWNDMYNAIANINNLIKNIEQADPRMFEGENYNIIRGEAYGLRAFMHFDLLRLFATAPAAGGASASAIPYVNDFGITVVSSSSVDDVIKNTLADLETAANALKTDPIIPGSTTVSSDNFLRDRQYKFNYYAVKALQARVYLYNNNKEQALACAREVLGSTAFTFVPSAEVAVSDVSQMNRVFTEELVFMLNINTIGTLSTTWLTAANYTALTKSDDNYKTVYEVNSGIGSTDYRYVYLTTVESGNRYYTKLAQPATIPFAFANKLPVIRRSEMYYIAAESVKDTDPEQAIAYINAVRRARGIATDIASTLNADEIQEEIYKEYEKETICEGQIFFYYKRLNKPTLRFFNGTATDAIYVLPKPDDEIEFGN